MQLPVAQLRVAQLEQLQGVQLALPVRELLALPAQPAQREY